MSDIKNDCEAEEQLWRNRHATHEMAKDVLKSAPCKIDKKLTDEFVQEKYMELYESTKGNPIPPDYQLPTKQQVMDWVVRCPEVRTLDTHLLMQRYLFDKENFEEVTRSVHPIIHRPIQKVIEQYSSKGNRRRKMMRKKQSQQQQLTEGFLEEVPNDQVYPMNQSPYPN